MSVVARVQKIINADPERLHTSKNAAFAIALATELFIQHLATTTHNVVKAETQKKPRRNVQYRDVATAVAKTDNLEFLVDVVPKTVLYKEVKERQAKKQAEEGERDGKGKETTKVASEDVVAGGNAMERLMAGSRKAAETEKGKAQKSKGEMVGGSEAMDVDQTPVAEEIRNTSAVQVEDSEPDDDGAAMQIEMEMRGPRSGRVYDKPAAESSPVPAANHRPTRSSTGGFTAINEK